MITSKIDNHLKNANTNTKMGEVSESSDPSTFLAEITGGQVIVKLHSGVEYQGKFNINMK